MSKKFTGVYSGGQNIPVYDKDAHSAIEQKLDTSAFQSVSGNFLTAVPDAYATKDYAANVASSAANAAASGKLDTDTFSQVSGDFLTAVPQSYLQNTDLTVTSGKVTEISGIPLSAGGGTLPDTIPVSGVSGISVTETENEVLIGISAEFATSADLENKLDTSAFSSVSGNFLTAVPENYSTKEYLSEQISGKYDTSSFAEVSGNFLTAVPESAISGFATHDEVESATSGKADVSALEGFATETYVDSAVSGKQDVTAMSAYQEKGDYYSASNPSGFLSEIPQSALSGYAEYSAISGKIAPSGIAIFKYNNSASLYTDVLAAFNAGKMCYLEDGYAGSKTYVPLVGMQTSDWLEKVAVFGKIKSVRDADSIYSANSYTLEFWTVNAAETRPEWGYGWDHVSITPVTNAAISGAMQASGLEYDGDKISGYKGSAFKAGDELPSGTMNTSALEYNAVNEISGYNGSAIAQYGAEKQWLQHDDTLVHAANSAQYALGVNLSAVAQLLGVDETVLFDTTAVNGAGVCNLSESLKNFKTIKVLATRGYNGATNPGGFAGPWSEWETDGISADGMDFHSIAPFMFEGVNWKNSMYSADSTFTTLTWYQGQQTNIITHVGSTANSFTGCVGIKKIIGIGRKQS